MDRTARYCGPKTYLNVCPTNPFQETRNEHEALSELKHLHIIDLITINMKEGLGLVMPYRRMNLKTFLKNEKKKITEELQIRYCMQISDAFRYIAYKKFVHGDLKASNILVVDIRHLEVCDFGKCESVKNRRKTMVGFQNFPDLILSGKIEKLSFQIDRVGFCSIFDPFEASMVNGTKCEVPPRPATNHFGLVPGRDSLLILGFFSLTEKKFSYITVLNLCSRSHQK